MSEQHSRRPIIVSPVACNIAAPALSSRIGTPLVRSQRYVRLWRGWQQLYTYSGPSNDDGTLAPDSDESGAYVVIVPNVQRTSGNGIRLGGAVLCAETTDGASVTWETGAGSGPDTILAITTPSGVTVAQLGAGSGLDTNLYQLYAPEFVHEYDSGSGLDWTYGVLTTTNIRVAALSVWTMPDPGGVIDDDDVLVSLSAVAPRRTIRGYDAADPVASLGDVVRAAHRTESTDQDGTETMGRPCLLQVGHPTGIQTTETSLVNVRAGLDAAFRVRPSNVRGDTADRRAYPVVYMSWTGAGAGNEAQVRFSSRVAGDSVTIAKTAVSGAGLAIGTGLSIDPVDDYVEVEFKAPTSGSVTLLTISLWEDEP